MNAISAVKEVEEAADKNAMTAVYVVFDDAIVQKRFQIAQLTPGDADPSSADTFLGSNEMTQTVKISGN